MIICNESPTEAEVRRKLHAVTGAATRMSQYNEPVLALAGSAWLRILKQIRMAPQDASIITNDGVDRRWAGTDAHLVDIEHDMGIFESAAARIRKLKLQPDLSNVEKLIRVGRLHEASEAFDQASRKERDVSARRGAGMSAGGRRAQELKYGTLQERARLWHTYANFVRDSVSKGETFNRAVKAAAKEFECCERTIRRHVPRKQ
jgi:hypothetical protein